jgi:hypothetical protein
LEHVTYSGVPLDDEELLSRLPANLAGLLRHRSARPPGLRNVMRYKARECAPEEGLP